MWEGDEMTESEQILAQMLNRVAQTDPRFNQFFRSSPAYRYYFIKGKLDRYFWTTETVTHNGKPRYASGIYKHIKTKNQLKLANSKYHAKRKDAKERALRLYQGVKQ